MNIEVEKIFGKINDEDKRKSRESDLLLFEEWEDIPKEKVLPGKIKRVRMKFDTNRTQPVLRIDSDTDDYTEIHINCCNYVEDAWFFLSKKQRLDLMAYLREPRNWVRILENWNKEAPEKFQLESNRPLINYLFLEEFPESGLVGEIDWDDL